MRALRYIAAALGILGLAATAIGFGYQIVLK